MKQNPKSDFQVCTTLIDRRCPTMKQRQYNSFSILHNFVSMLFQRWYNIISKLFQRGLSSVEAISKLNLASEKYGFAERLISFIVLNDKIFFTIY